VRRRKGQKCGRLYNMFKGNPDKRGGEYENNKLRLPRV
jgi:hypothetical protein